MDCKKCKKQLQWDWDQDVFMVAGEICNVQYDEFSTDATMFCTCSEHLGVLHEDGSISEPKWLADVNWEDDCNKFVSQRVV